MPPTMDEAICIRQWDWSETSQTVSLMTERSGLVRGLAKGSKRPKAPYSGGIELLTQATAGIITRRSSDLALITEWDLNETFPVLRRELKAHRVALYMADLLHHAISDHDPHPGLYHALLGALRSIGERDRLDTILLQFQWSVLVETGYKPELDEVPRVTPLLFSPSRGGFVASIGEASDAWRVRPQTLEVLRALENGASNLDALTASPPTPSGTPGRANRLLAAYLRYVIGREPKTLPMLFGDDLPT